ncbi:6-phosphogluconolactonase [Micropruina sonneratiae]|uniref:6-phosphogluconolactonase n=1 Tax=Micropruina sonneratiae TaxID=2986940 RepID=UPI002227B41D|nr:6-phosphogluconolactonase [Micropruina sp. KQZ13P-5]MCW3157189.1 6-phosphogluconolactonase [Micropruina sp. KQZ13P-5]
MNDQVLRFTRPVTLAETAAGMLVSTIAGWQKDPDRIVQLGLTGGRIAQHLYDSFGSRIEGSELDPGRLELWWTDERFVPTDDPARHAGPTLAQLAGRFALDPARTHPMPAADGVADADAAAATYAKELDDVRFDICLLSIGPEGHVAGIFPGHPSFEATTQSVIGLTGSPKGEDDRISLTVPALGRSREVWFLANGPDKAHATAQALAGDPGIPAGVVRGEQDTRWFIDREAASELPWYNCSL